MTNNETPRCKYCSKRLIRQIFGWDKFNKTPEPIVGQKTDLGIIEKVFKAKETTYGRTIKYWTGRWGYRGCGVFCSLNCGFRWAVNYLIGHEQIMKDREKAWNSGR